MDAHQTTFELAMEPAGHPLATTPCWAALQVAGHLPLYPGDGLLAPYALDNVPPGDLFVPHGSQESMAWAMCGQQSVASLMGCSMDYIRHAWQERVYGPASVGSSTLQMVEFLDLFMFRRQAFSTEKPEGANSWKCRWIHEDLMWPICGLVGVTLPNGDRHWIAHLNWQVYDCLIGEIISLRGWDRLNQPYTIDDVIVIGDGILSRRDHWRVPNYCLPNASVMARPDGGPNT